MNRSNRWTGDGFEKPAGPNFDLKKQNFYLFLFKKKTLFLLFSILNKNKEREQLFSLLKEEQ
jgi:hypothetical protein